MQQILHLRAGIPFSQERMKAGLSVPQTLDIPDRRQAEVKVVVLHIASCMPASVKSGGSA
jgi:hypothetical protein